MSLRIAAVRNPRGEAFSARVAIDFGARKIEKSENFARKIAENRGAGAPKHLARHPHASCVGLRLPRGPCGAKRAPGGVIFAPDAPDFGGLRFFARKIAENARDPRGNHAPRARPRDETSPACR